jgi:hypothetical protein
LKGVVDGEAVTGDARNGAPCRLLDSSGRVVKCGRGRLRHSRGEAATGAWSAQELDILGSMLDGVPAGKRIPRSAMDEVMNRLPSRSRWAIVKRLTELRRSRGKVVVRPWSVCELEVLRGVLDRVPDGESVSAGAIREAMARLPGRSPFGIRYGLDKLRLSRGPAEARPSSVRDGEVLRGVLDGVSDGEGLASGTAAEVVGELPGRDCG